MPIRVMVLCVSLALGVRQAVAQEVSRQQAPDASCIEFNRTVVNQVANGRLAEAETALSDALASKSNGFEQSCAWLVLHNMAIVVALSGRLAEAEVLVQRCLKILEKNYPPDDPALLRPLHLLLSIRFDQRKIARAREVFQRMQSVHTGRPADRALVHGAAAALLQAEGRDAEAEPEYFKALTAWQEAGRGETADAVAVLNALGSLYIAGHRYAEAVQTLNRALAIASSAKDVVPTDRIKLLHARAILYARQGEWRDAEEDLRSAISTASQITQLDPVTLQAVLADYAHVLRKNHRAREARSVEARAAALPTRAITDTVVDLSELLPRPKTPGR